MSVEMNQFGLSNLLKSYRVAVDDMHKARAAHEKAGQERMDAEERVANIKSELMEQARDYWGGKLALCAEDVVFIVTGDKIETLRVIRQVS